MIPKKIHYCWFGGNPLPELYKAYMQSWRKYCPDYEIVQWNETNFDVTQNVYCSQAYKAKKWAFVSDYARLKVIYENGGVYLDTDVELLKDITPLIADGIGFIGFQNPIEVNTGLGFAAEPHNEAVKAMLDIYEKRQFVFSDGTYNITMCTTANTFGLIECGLKINQPWCASIQTLKGLRVYPEDYFNSLNYDTQKLKITPNTYMIHHYAATWVDNNQKLRKAIKRFLPSFILRKRAERISRRNLQLIAEEIDKC